MSDPNPKNLPSGNLLLGKLPAAVLQRLVSRMHFVPLDFKQVLYKSSAPVKYIYFPIRGAASAVTVMEDGSAIEIATIGNEGVVGLSAVLAGQQSPWEIIIQIKGDAYRIAASVLTEEMGKESALRQLLLDYQTVFLTQVAQSVACNGLHPILQRCCRWLLITRDRMESDEFPLTHEFLGVMLGVRLATITEVLHPLREKGLIDNTRGSITILDRKGLEQLSCECYRKVRDEYDRLLK